MAELFSVPAPLAAKAWIDAARYRQMYDQSISNPDAFWGEQGKLLHWIKPYTKVKNTSFDGDVRIRLVRRWTF